jgi:hypothetical protein
MHRFTVGQRRTLACILLLSGALSPACTLITDVNREDIPTPATPVFPEGDGGADAAVPDPVPNPIEPEDAGAADAGESLDDGGADAGDDVDEIVDAGADGG